MQIILKPIQGNIKAEANIEISTCNNLINLRKATEEFLHFFKKKRATKQLQQKI